MLRGKSGGNSEGQEFVICIGWGLVRDGGRESFCMVLVGSVGRSVWSGQERWLCRAGGKQGRTLRRPGSRRRRRRDGRRGQVLVEGLLLGIK